MNPAERPVARGKQNQSFSVSISAEMRDDSTTSLILFIHSLVCEDRSEHALPDLTHHTNTATVNVLS